MMPSPWATLCLLVWAAKPPAAPAALARVAVAAQPGPAAAAQPRAASAALPGDVAAFAHELEKAQGLTLADHWKVPGEHGGDAWLLRFEKPDEPDSHQVSLVLWGGADDVFTRRAFNVGHTVEVTPEPDAHAFSLRLTDDVQTFGLRDGRPVMVRVTHSGKLAGFGEGTQTEDWDALTFRRTLETGQGKHRRVLEIDEGAILLVTNDDPRSLPPTWTRVTDGKDKWHGRQDGSLQVRAEPAEAGVALRLHARDNTHVPVPAHGRDRAFAAADHFELWWKSPRGLRQVGVGVDKDGQVQLRRLFLKDEKLALPTAQLEDGDIVVQFDAPSLGGDRAIAEGVPFTVAYSDCDVKGKGMQSVVSTSAFHFRTSTLGVLIALPGFARWPVSPGEAPWCHFEPGAPPAKWSDC